MDGVKGLLNRSLQVRLLLTLSGMIVLMALLSSGTSFFLVHREAHESQDQMLQQVAGMFDQQHLPLPKVFLRPDPGSPKDEWPLGVQVLSARFSTDADAPHPIVREHHSEGLHTILLDGQQWRIMAKTLDSGEQLIIGQPTAFRSEIAMESAMGTFIPLLLLLPAGLFAVIILVQRIFLPLRQAAGELKSRPDYDLRPIEGSPLPSELDPFVAAINHLLERVQAFSEEQKQFIANAAHELRSPLTALALQAEVLGRSQTPEENHQRLQALMAGIQRSRNLIDQLLMLALVQGSDVRPPQSICIKDIFRQVLEDYSSLAEAKDLDIGANVSVDQTLLVDATDLLVLVKNLVDNAIRYTPPRGQIDLSASVSDGCMHIEVEDSGIGIHPDERAKVFNPFYRVLGHEVAGSGLGLSIVKRIVDRLHARIELAESRFCCGLRVRVSIPLPREEGVLIHQGVDKRCSNS